MRIAINDFNGLLDGLSIEEIGFLVRLQQISEVTVCDAKGRPETKAIPLTLQQIANHMGIHTNTAKKMRKALAEKGAIRMTEVFHENGSSLGHIYESSLTFRF